MKTLLVSACLMGIKCRYDGKSNQNDQVLALKSDYHLVPVCPEQLGGLSTPRTPCEIRNSCVLSATGQDMTESYMRGAAETLRLAKILNPVAVIFKERSPSCGHGEIYDGTFSHTLISGDGITTRLLKENGILVFGDSRIERIL